MNIIKELNEQNLQKISNELKNGDVVAIPTETVYGLAADALNSKAVEKIFKVKGRPSDNPLIVHIANLNMMRKFVQSIPNRAIELAKNFWPGPLTIILKKSKIVPSITTGGLASVAIRCPNHPMALKIIKYSNMGLAAPSANISGKPSPTTAAHCVHDLNGKIDIVVDGGSCGYGVESTVISLFEEKPVIFRPGAVTKEDIEQVIGEVDIAPSVLNKLENGKQVVSPGMKYKHYAPSADVVLIESNIEQFANYVNNIKSEGVIALVFEGEEKYINKKCFTYGIKGDGLSQSKKIFTVLRAIDDMDVKKVYVRAPEKIGVGLAVYNRLIRAANFNLITLK